MVTNHNTWRAAVALALLPSAAMTAGLVLLLRSPAEYATTFRAQPVCADVISTSAAGRVLLGPMALSMPNGGTPYVAPVTSASVAMACLLVLAVGAFLPGRRWIAFVSVIAWLGLGLLDVLATV